MRKNKSPNVDTIEELLRSFFKEKGIEQFYVAYKNNVLGTEHLFGHGSTNFSLWVSMMMTEVARKNVMHRVKSECFSNLKGEK